MVLSRCCQVRKGAQVFALRIIPGIGSSLEGMMSIGFDLPVHLPMNTTAITHLIVTAAPNCDELTLIVGDCASSQSNILKLKML